MQTKPFFQLGPLGCVRIELEGGFASWHGVILPKEIKAQKYRRKTLTPELLDYLGSAFKDILSAWRCDLLEFGGESDHAHLLIDVHPALNVSVLINNLKTASARRARNRFADHIARFYTQPMFWHRAYFVSSVGGATLDTVKAYVEAQGTEEHARKKKGPRKPA